MLEYRTNYIPYGLIPLCRELFHGFRFREGQNTFGWNVVRTWVTETLNHLLANILIQSRWRWLQHVKYKPHTWSDARGWLQTRSREKLPLLTVSGPDIFRSALNDFMCAGSRLRGDNRFLEIGTGMLLKHVIFFLCWNTAMFQSNVYSVNYNKCTLIRWDRFRKPVWKQSFFSVIWSVGERFANARTTYVFFRKLEKI